MSEKEFALATLAVGRLEFVDRVNIPAHGTIVFVELSPRLTQVLPPAHCVLQIAKADFSVQEVIRLYKVYVVDHLEEIADLAHQMLWAAQKHQPRS